MAATGFLSRYLSGITVQKNVLSVSLNKTFPSFPVLTNHLVAVLLQTVHVMVDHVSSHDLVLNSPCAVIHFLITDMVLSFSRRQ